MAQTLPLGSSLFKTKGRGSRSTPSRTPSFVGVLKPEAQHELQLPGQTRAGVRRCYVVIVTVEVHRRCDQAEARVRGEESRSCSGWVIAEVQLVRVAQLRVIKNVKRLKTKLDGKSLVYLRVLHKRQVNLPGGQSSD